MIRIDNTLVLRYIVPFRFENGYDGLYRTLTDAPKWEHCTEPVKSPSVFRYLYDSVYGAQADNSVGSVWRFKSKLPKLRYREKDGEEPSDWRIKDAQLHIFHTNVGLVWYELVPANPKAPLLLEDMILLQNRFKDCGYTDDHFQQERPRRSKEDETVYDSFDAALWLSELLEPLGTFHFLNGSCSKGGKECPSKALIFNYLLLDSSEPVEKEVLQSAAFLLANGYNRKYRPSWEALQTGIHPFTDVCLYASRSGCGYYAAVNSGNRGFFAGNFNQTIRDEYFFLYILVLHQSYSLMNFSRQSIENYSSDPNSYNMAGEVGLRLDQLAAELHTFLMKSMHTSVSGVQHHNEFYNYLKERLMIQSDIDSIKIGVDALVELQRVRREHAEALQHQQEAERENRQDRRQNVVLAILSLLSLFAVFKDLDELLEKFYALDLGELWKQICSGSVRVISETVIYCVVLVIVIICITVLIINFIPFGKKSDKKKR